MLCEALGAIDSGGADGGCQRQSGHLRLLRQQAADDGRGGDDRPAPSPLSPPACAPNAIRAGPPTWAGSTTVDSASTTDSPTSPRRSASPNSSDSTRCWRSRSRVAALYEEGLADIEDMRRRAPGVEQSGAAGSSTLSFCRADMDRDEAIARLAQEGIASKAYLPCIHLFPQLRELGYREGQFPVAEAASAHSLALPFFPTMSESQVERVCEALIRSF